MELQEKKKKLKEESFQCYLAVLQIKTIFTGCLMFYQD